MQTNTDNYHNCFIYQSIKCVYIYLKFTEFFVVKKDCNLMKEIKNPNNFTVEPNAKPEC